MLLPSAILYLLLLLFSALPLLVLSFTFGGVDVSDFLRTTGATILVLAAVCALGLWCSSLFRRSVHCFLHARNLEVGAPGLRSLLRFLYTRSVALELPK